MRILWRIAARYYTARAGRAQARAALFAARAEKFFARVKGVW